MPEDNGITSVFSTVAVVAAVISCVMFIFALLAVVKRLRSEKKKNSGIGVLCVILGTVFAVIAFQLYVGFSLWFIIGIIVVDSVLVLLLTE